MTRKTITIGEIFTEDEIKKAFAIIEAHAHAESPTTPLNEKLIVRIVAPAMPRINKATGQENDAGYMAYVLQYAHSMRHTIGGASR